MSAALGHAPARGRNRGHVWYPEDTPTMEGQHTARCPGDGMPRLDASQRAALSPHQTHGMGPREPPPSSWPFPGGLLPRRRTSNPQREAVTGVTPPWPADPPFRQCLTPRVSVSFLGLLDTMSCHPGLAQARRRKGLRTGGNAIPSPACVPKDSTWLSAHIQSLRPVS